MSDTKPVIMWFRRDLRLGDHPALTEVSKVGQQVIPLFINDKNLDTLGAAAKMRLGMSVLSLASDLADRGSKLILRRGDALEVLRRVIAETGAGSVVWSRLYDPESRARDEPLKAALKEDGIDVQSFGGHLLFEPWTVETGQGNFYKVYTPMWKNVRTREVPDVLPVPSTIPAPAQWPDSDDLADWALDAAMHRGRDVLAPYCTVGERAAHDRLGAFIEDKVAKYQEARDLPAVDGTSRLSENLTYGEISPRTLWHAGQQALQDGKPGAETFLKEVVWREFAYHLVYHTPRITSDNWREGWDAFPWNTEDTPEVLAWKQGRTGVPFVDAAMREMYVTGTMHNRGRMIVASYLTKHLMTHWKVGMAWFDDCLIDWDPASNAMGWQWAAGSGPDAAPYFRIFNPVTQLDKFDRPGGYARRWIAEGHGSPSATALSYFDAVPQSWGLDPADRYPRPVVSLEAGRNRALEAYKSRSF